MIIKNKLNSLLWWLDICILNLDSITYKYSYTNNIFFFNLNFNWFYNYFIINKYNLNTTYFYILDMLYLNNNVYISSQSFFFDIKILIESNIENFIQSISKIYPGCLWLEREMKEFSDITIFNLKDTRKLLTNYGYNKDMVYTNYNNIINDLYS